MQVVHRGQQVVLDVIDRRDAAQPLEAQPLIIPQEQRDIVPALGLDDRVRVQTLGDHFGHILGELLLNDLQDFFGSHAFLSNRGKRQA